LFVEVLGDLSFDWLVWDSICRRLVLPPARSGVAIEIPLICGVSLDGIISYLTRKHGGNVHHKGIVTITSKSLSVSEPGFVADLDDTSSFISLEGPGQWICWDFQGMRVRPTRLTIQVRSLKSWVVEASLDGTSWTEIDRQTDNQHVYQSPRSGARMLISFPVSNVMECRFIRLTQTGTDRWASNVLTLFGVEFFGTLWE
jgi:hypothetical protein